MSSRYLLCTDLDRTLLPNGSAPESPGARELFSRLASKAELQLAYVSGRSLDLVCEAMETWQLPVPDYILGDVGTSIYTPASPNEFRQERTDRLQQPKPREKWCRWQLWDTAIARDWNGWSRSGIASLLTGVGELELQEVHKQSTFKLSFYVALDVDEKALQDKIQTILSREGIRASLIWSIDEASGIGLFDVLPARATKRHAVEFLMQQQRFEVADTVFAGDSGNDIPVLVSPIQSVLVANASPSVREEALREADVRGLTQALYLARGGFLGMNGNYSAGIIEGFVHYIPQSEQWLQGALP